MTNFLVSVIIPTYGRAELLNRCIDSILNQTYQNIEIIVVDDNGSGTEHQLMTEKNLLKYDNIKYLALGRNSGGGLARNEGVRMSSGEIITFLDDDDVYYPDKVDLQIKEMIKSHADVCLCNMKLVNHGIAHFGEEYSVARGTSLQEFLNDGIAFTPMIMVKKHLFEKVGGFMDTPKFQDHTLMLKLLADGAKVTILDKQLFEHHSYNIKRISNSPASLKGYLNRFGLENKLLREHGLKKNVIKLNQFLALKYFLRERKSVIYNLRYLMLLSKYMVPDTKIRSLFFLYKDYMKYLIKKIIKNLRFE